MCIYIYILFNYHLLFYNVQDRAVMRGRIRWGLSQVSALSSFMYQPARRPLSCGPCHVHAVEISPHAGDFFPMYGIPWPWTVGRCLTFTHTAALSSAAGLTTHQRRAGAWCLPCSIGQVCVTSHSVRGPHRLVLSSPHHLAVQKMPNAKHFLHQGIGSPDGVYIYSINPLETAAILGWSPPVSEYVFWQDSLMETFYLQGGLGL